MNSLHPVDVRACRLSRLLSVAEIGLMETMLVPDPRSSDRGAKCARLDNNELNGLERAELRTLPGFMWKTLIVDLEERV